VPAIARLVAADEDTVRDVIHAFNARGLDALDPRWAGGRPRLISNDDVEFIVATATTRPPIHGLRISRERLRQLLRARGVSHTAVIDLDGTLVNSNDQHAIARTSVGDSR
jgi:transposase